MTPLQTVDGEGRLVGYQAVTNAASIFDNLTPQAPQQNATLAPVEVTASRLPDPLLLGLVVLGAFFLLAKD